MFHHKKTCNGKRQRFQCAESTTLLHDTDDVSFEGLVHDQELHGTDDVSFEGLVQDQETNHEPVAALNAPVAHPTIVQVKRVSLSPRMKEILTFLATAERGEGCSRENAQCWLDYQHAKGGQNAKLLPKDIRTLWSHVAAVLYVMSCFMFACTI